MLRGGLAAGNSKAQPAWQAYFFFAANDKPFAARDFLILTNALGPMP